MAEWTNGAICWNTLKPPSSQWDKAVDIMGDQQERPVDKHFVAGVIVAEGCFGLDCHSHHGLKLRFGYAIRPKFCLQMHDAATMKLICEEWDRLGLPIYYCDVPTGMRIEIQGCKRVKRVLDVFLPLLTGEKKSAAEVVRRFIALRFSKSPRAPYSREEMECVNEIRRINSPNSRYGKRMIDVSTGILRDLTPRAPTA